MNNFIGLDIKKNTLRFASVTQKDASIVVDKFDEVIVEGNLYKTSVAMKENQLEKEMSGFFKQNKLKQNNVIYCDFGFNLLIKNATIIESLNKQKVKEAIFMELGTSISIPFEEATFDILSVKPLEKKEKNDESEPKKHKKSVNLEKREQEVNFVVANEKDLVYIGDSIIETKNIPYAVEMSALAYHRLLAHFSSLKIKRNMYLLFELNCGEAVMTVMHKGVPIYTQYAEYNPDHWRVNIDASKENWSDEWLFDEVYERNKLLSSIDSMNRLINSFSNMTSSSSGIKYILLMGENPLIETGMAEFLTQHIDLPIITPELNIVDSKNKLLPVRYYKAVGLAMKKEELK